MKYFISKDQFARVCLNIHHKKIINIQSIADESRNNHLLLNQFPFSIQFFCMKGEEKALEKKGDLSFFASSFSNPAKRREKGEAKETDLHPAIRRAASMPLKV